MPEAKEILTKDILTWCFTVAALVFGVFGFLYSTYATASFQAAQTASPRPPIVYVLRRFCRVLAVILAVLTGLAAAASFSAGVALQTWIIVGCFIVLTFMSVWLAMFLME
jgi:quinol-cytochrome oxidoreductase complex cytochrome b subunit